MAVYTPRGLKIRLPVDYTFALLTRLYPQVDAFRVLKTTEGIDCIPPLLAFCAGLICFASHAHPFYIAVAVVISSSLGTLLTCRGLFIVPGLVALGTMYSYLAGYGIYFVTLLVVGYFTVGLWGIAAYFIARGLGLLIQQVIEFAEVKAAYDATGIPVTASERHFLNAYRLHAVRAGETRDVEVTEEELDERHWAPVFRDLCYKWPAVVQRFTPD